MPTLALLALNIIQFSVAQASSLWTDNLTSRIPETISKGLLGTGGEGSALTRIFAKLSDNWLSQDRYGIEGNLHLRKLG